MAQLSQSEAQAAISAIIDREEREGIISPELISQRNQLWIRRNHIKHFQPLFAEVADKMGWDENKIAKLFVQHQKETRQYLDEQQAETDKHFASLLKDYNAAWANKKAAIEHLTDAFPTLPMIYLDRPNFIFSASGLVLEDHIESFKTWAKVSFNRSENFSWGYKDIGFFFSWQNDSDDQVIFKKATAFLTARGRCSAHADWSVTWPNWANLWVVAILNVYLGETRIDSEQETITTCQVNDVHFGGSANKDVFTTVLPSVPEFVVQGHQLVILSARVRFGWGIGKGEVRGELDKNEPFLSCPLLTLEVGSFLETFSETLTADEAGWEGYCLVQRIEPVRLSRGGTKIRLTLRASSASAAYIDRIFISQADPAGDPYDSAADLKELHRTRLTVPAGAAVTTPYVDYTLDPQRPLIVAFDFGGAPPSGIRYRDAVPPAEASAYWQSGHQAGNTDRGGTFEPENRIYLIEKIEVQ